MLSPASRSVTGDIGSQRRTKMVEAFLAHRLSRAQLCDLMSTETDKWEDTFALYTAPENDLPVRESKLSIEQAVQDLGLKERLLQLQDDQVWSREDRALYRVMAHFEQEVQRPKPDEKAKNPQAFFETALTYFSQWDRNGDLALDMAEMDLAMSGGYYGERTALANEPQAAAALSTLMQKRRMLASSNPNDGENVSQTDILTAQSRPDQRIAAISDDVALTYEETLERARQMKAAKQVSHQAMDPLPMKQGVVGSCVLLSTTATVSPERLRQMMQDAADGNVKVEFSNKAQELVRPLTLAERSFHASAGVDETWPAVLEIAVAQRLYAESSQKYGSLREAIDGVSPQDAIRLLAGQDTDQRMLDELTVDQCRTAVQELLAYKGPILCGSRPNALGDFVSVEDLHNGIVNGHAYSVFGYDSETDRVKLRNPWGRKEWVHQDSPDDGIFDMPMRDFYSSFRWVAAANGKPAPEPQ